MMNIIKYLWRKYLVLKRWILYVNSFKTIYFNYKMLPLSKAIYLPIKIGRNTELRSLKGSISIDDNIRLSPGIFSINVETGPCSGHYEKSVVVINGKIIFHRPVVHFFAGSLLWVDGVLDLGGDILIGSHSKVICFNHIEMGNYISVSWDCQIYDTNFHYFHNLPKNTIAKRNGSISIGNRVFIGNNVSITKDSSIPDGCVISNFTHVNNRTEISQNDSLVAGNPASVVKVGYTRVLESSIMDSTNERRLAQTLDDIK